MTRGNKFGERKKAPEESIESLLEIIVEDVIKTSTMSFDEWRALSQFPVSLAIPVSHELEYRVTQVGIDAAHKITQQTWQSREDFRQKIIREEFDKLSFAAIGETILNSSAHLPQEVEDSSTLPDDDFFTVLANDYVDNLKLLIDQVCLDVDRHIPCHLFHHDQNVPAFSIGPVVFQPRADWIESYVKDSNIRGYIQQVETGDLRIDELRQMALLPTSARDVFSAWRILNSLQGFAWVATIKMVSHELSQSHHKASIIVGLAIDAIGLRFQAADAMRFAKAGRQHLSAENWLATLDNGKLLSGTKMEMPGLGSKPGLLADKMVAERPFFDAAGCLLDAYVQGRQTGSAIHLVERWANALFWFGEARREQSDFMAIVNYGCAADGLSGAGGEAKIMTEFAEAALNPKGESTPHGSVSIADAVTAVYREGRNKLAHGETPGLLEDLTETRRIGDSLLVNLFDVVTAELASLVVSNSPILTVTEKHAYRAFIERLKNLN